MRIVATIPLLLALALAIAACDNSEAPPAENTAPPVVNTPPPTADDAEAIVAAELCPNDPAHIEPELLATIEEGLWAVYVRTSEAVTDAEQASAPENHLAKFVILSGQGETLVLASDPDSKSYQNSLLGTC